MTNIDDAVGVVESDTVPGAAVVGGAAGAGAGSGDVKEVAAPSELWVPCSPCNC